MKVNKIPEKIYLSYETDDEDDKNHIFIDYMWHRHPFDRLINIEYTRTDALIENAWDWIENNILSSNQQDKSLLYYEQFKNFMKGE